MARPRLAVPTYRKHASGRAVISLYAASGARTEMLLPATTSRLRFCIESGIGGKDYFKRNSLPEKEPHARMETMKAVRWIDFKM